MSAAEVGVPVVHGDATVPPPFRHVLDSSGRQTGWTLIDAPLVTVAQQDCFARLRRAGHRFIGVCSYLAFPRGFDDHPLDYEAVCEGWCHCLREPHRFLPMALPRALISMSDFTDPQQVSPDRIEDVGDFDFVYVGAGAPWKREAKNWGLAACCVARLCRDLGLRALVIGSPTEEFVTADGLTFRSHLPWHELLAQVAGAQFLLVPNGCDPSPRVVAEALCLDVPVVVNREILGGWKYVNRFTGSFFEGEHGVLAAAREVRQGRCAPRRWFQANHGPYLAGRRLLSFVRSLDPTLDERSHLCLSESDAVPVVETSRSRPAVGAHRLASNGSTAVARHAEPSGSEGRRV